VSFFVGVPPGRAPDQRLRGVSGAHRQRVETRRRRKRRRIESPVRVFGPNLLAQPYWPAEDGRMLLFGPAVPSNSTRRPLQKLHGHRRPGNAPSVVESSGPIGPFVHPRGACRCSSPDKPEPPVAAYRFLLAGRTKTRRTAHDHETPVPMSTHNRRVDRRVSRSESCNANEARTTTTRIPDSPTDSATTDVAPSESLRIPNVPPRPAE